MIELQWPTYEEFVAGNLETRALSDARGEAVVEDDAWQTNVMVRVASGEQFDLEPMPVEVQPDSPEMLRGRSVSFPTLNRTEFDAWVKERYRLKTT